MKPYPLAPLNHLTVPLSFTNELLSTLIRKVAEACLQRVSACQVRRQKKRLEAQPASQRRSAAFALRSEPALMLNPTAEAQNINPLAWARPPQGSARRAGHNIQELRILAS